MDKYFNVYIEHSAIINQYIIVLNETQIKKFVDAYLLGLDCIRIKGVDRNIKNPKKFIIYSLDPSQLGREQSEIENNFVKNRGLTKNNKVNLSLYRVFGANVTDSLTNGLSWGALRDRGTDTTSAVQGIAGKIFISHSIKDSKIVQAFTENILELGLGLKTNDIFNISIEDAGIKTGEDFKVRIEKELKTAKAVIQIITKNYKESEACLNEMGAAWILNIPVIPFILEPISFGSVGFIHNTTQLLQLNSKKSIKSFIANNKGDLFSPNYDDSKLDRKVEEFINSIDSTDLKQTSKISKIDDHLDAAIKNIQTDNPFFKINQQSNPYYYRDKMFCEIMDDYTLIFLGYNKWGKATYINLTNKDLKEKIGQACPSIIDSEIWVAGDDDKQWIIYDGFRHHIPDNETINLLRKKRKKDLNYKYVLKSELEALIQGDIFTLNTSFK